MRLYLFVLMVFRVEGKPTDGCSSPGVIRLAEEALGEINQEQTQGYVLMLNRVYDVSTTVPEGKSGLLYRMTVDVLETNCHVSSRKPWKKCELRDLGSVPVYGECEVSVLVESQVQLQSYSCVLREIPAVKVVRECPDCPTADDLNDPIVRDTSSLCLQRFNEESGLSNYFRLDNITKAYSQWVFGPNYVVEFTVVETVCSKNTDPSELSSCTPMDCQFAHRGFCVGNHASTEEEFEKVEVKKKKTHNVQVKCEIYEPQVAEVEKTAHSKAEAGHIIQEHHNHTHLHPHEHEHSPPPDQTLSQPTVSIRGSVVYGPAPKRTPPSSSSCPGTRKHQMLRENLHQ